MFNDDDGLRVCTSCICDKYLTKEIRSEGLVAKCSYCGKRRSTVLLLALAEQVHEIIEGFFSLTLAYPEGLEYLLAKDPDCNYQWTRAGDPVDVVIAAS